MLVTHLVQLFAQMDQSKVRLLEFDATGENAHKVRPYAG